MSQACTLPVSAVGRVCPFQAPPRSFQVSRGHHPRVPHFGEQMLDAFCLARCAVSADYQPRKRRLHLSARSPSALVEIVAASSASQDAKVSVDTGDPLWYRNKGKPERVEELPLRAIRRPLGRTRANDPEKVQWLMGSIAEIGLQEPIDVLEVDGVYYGFSGCHRYEAHQRLGMETIKCRVRKATPEVLRMHMA